MSSRGIAVSLNYVLVLGISTVLVAGLIIAGGTFVEDKRERVIEGELRIIGNHIAGNLEQVDRYVNASKTTDPEVAYVNQTFQTQVTGTTYRAELQQKGGVTQVRLVSSEPEVTVTVNATVRTQVDTDATASGGTISAAYDGTELVIRDV